VLYVYDHLVALGVYRDLTAAVVGVIVARIGAYHPLKKLHKRLKSIEDQLDTSTPGGITDVVQELNHIEETASRRENGDETV
jgi:hypothetical protein